MKCLLWLGCTLFATCVGFAAETPATDARPVFDVTAFGAVGDGTTDDNAAVKQAIQAVTEAGGGKLVFPLGTYRIAKGGTTIRGVSNLWVYFEPGAKLLMDNIDPESGIGHSHGLVIGGPARNIRVENAWVEWSRMAAKRSMGDAFRFEGFPDDEKTLSHIQFLHGRANNSPQVGAIFMGCSDVVVEDFRCENTLADGLHLNACRRVSVNGLTGINNGDDTLAFVTYYGKDGEELDKPHEMPFTQETLGEWNNTNSVATNIVARGGRANGMRISGGRNIAVNNLNVMHKPGGMQIDAARRNVNPRTVGWSYLASRGISVSNVTISNCGEGLVVRTLNIPPDMPDAHWKSDVTLSNIIIRDCKVWGCTVIDSAGFSIANLYTNTRSQLRNARGLYSLSHAVFENCDLLIDGVQTEAYTGQKRNGEGADIRPAALSDLPEYPLELSDITVLEGTLSVRAAAGVNLRGLRLHSSMLPRLDVQSSRLIRISAPMLAPSDGAVRVENSEHVVIETAAGTLSSEKTTAQP